MAQKPESSLSLCSRPYEGRCFYSEDYQNLHLSQDQSPSHILFSKNTVKVASFCKSPTTISLNNH